MENQDNDENVVLEKTIKTHELATLLRIKDMKTIYSLIKEAKIKIVENSDNLIARDDIKFILGVTDLPDKFLTIKEVADILQMTPGKVSSLCSQGLLTFYKIRKAKGSKLLFIKEEVLECSKCLSEADLIYIDRYSSVNTFWKLEQYKRIVSFIMLHLYSKHNALTSREYDVLTDILFEGKSMKECGKKFDLTSERIRQIFESGVRKLQSAVGRMPEFFTHNKELEEEAMRLRVENSSLKKKLAEIGNPVEASFLQTRIDDLNLSVRVLNCLHAEDIITIQDLIRHSQNDLLKLRNFGRNSLNEIKELLKSNGLELRRY